MTVIGAVFQLAATRRRLVLNNGVAVVGGAFQLAATRRRLAIKAFDGETPKTVSTRSHAKAAGCSCRGMTNDQHSFNSQPREGGWSPKKLHGAIDLRFNSQPREGGWTICLVLEAPFKCFNSQPREGGWKAALRAWARWRCFNSQPREGGWHANDDGACYPSQFQLAATRRRLERRYRRARRTGRFNSQPREGGWPA